MFFVVFFVFYVYFFFHILFLFSFFFFFFFNDTATTEIYTLFPTRRSSDLRVETAVRLGTVMTRGWPFSSKKARSEEHTSELQSRQYLVCRLLLEKKKKQ